ncbi:helix-turn-helix transcriptional regulator [Acetobacteraceae bacterium H6797]|nr:helix-turn-helix transcriptional regulator [Acetobacteraceae bacterium H6797]
MKRVTTCQPLPAWRLAKVLNYIEDNLAGDMGVPLLAQQTGLSTGYFARAFRKSLGVPPHAYVFAQRVARAREMMLSSSESLTVIALECGFCDQAHLTKHFRRALGITPAAWLREQHPAPPTVLPRCEPPRQAEARRASMASVRLSSLAS